MSVALLSIQGGMGHWAVYYTSPQSFIMFSYSFGSTTLGTFNEFWLIGAISWVSIPLTTNCNRKKGKFCLSSFFSYSLTYQPIEFLWILICWFIKFSIQTFKPLIVINRRVRYVIYHWGCRSIYRPYCLIPLILMLRYLSMTPAKVWKWPDM